MVCYARIGVRQCAGCLLEQKIISERLKYALQSPIDEEVSRNINRQSAPKFLGVTMACRQFGIVKAAKAAAKTKGQKVSSDHPLSLTDTEILRAKSERDLDFPASFRITEKRGELFCIDTDLSTLRIMLRTAREKFSGGGHSKAKLAASLPESVRQYKSWAEVLPGHLALGGTYILPHLLRKHSLGYYMERWATPTNDAFIERLFSLDGRKSEQPEISSMKELIEISPDQRNLLANIPPHLSLAKLSRLLGCPSLLLPCFACLWSEAADKMPAECQVCQAAPERLSAGLLDYEIEFNIPPCPFLLIKRAIAARLPASVPEDGADEAGCQD